MNSIFAEPIELLRVERDPYAEMHSPRRPFRIVLFGPETDVTEGRSEGVTDAVLNLSRADLSTLRDICNDLLAEDAPAEHGGAS